MLPNPGIDCLNHGGSAGACGTLALGASSWDLEGERSVNFVTTRDVAAGEQVRAGPRWLLALASTRTVSLPLAGFMPPAAAG